METSLISVRDSRQGKFRSSGSIQADQKTLRQVSDLRFGHKASNRATCWKPIEISVPMVRFVSLVA